MKGDFSQWAGLSTAIISDCLNRFQVMESGIRRFSGEGTIGFAFTVRCMVGESATVHRAVAVAPPESVLVVDSGGYVDRSVWGEILTAAAVARRISGVIVDGAIRDLEAIRNRGFPLYAKAVSPAGPHKGWQGDLGATIQCGRVAVSPGDLIVADFDGVVVVPADQMGDVLTAAAARAGAEKDWIGRIENGESSVSVLGIDDRHKEGQ